MAFKFKVKKRPGLGQAVASAFSVGAVQGGKAALQKMVQEREELKKQSTKELNLFNSGVSGLPQTPKNLSQMVAIRSQILKGQITGVEGMDVIAGGDIDYQTEKEKESSFTQAVKLGESAKKVREAEATALKNVSTDPELITAERKAQESIGMLQPKPTGKEVEVREQEADIRLGLTSEDAQKNAYNKVTKERVFATNVEIASDPNLVPISVSPKGESKKQVSSASIQKSIKNLQDQLSPIRRNISGFPPLSQEERLQKLELLDKLIKRSTEISLGNETISTTTKEKIEF